VACSRTEPSAPAPVSKVQEKSVAKDVAPAGAPVVAPSPKADAPKPTLGTKDEGKMGHKAVVAKMKGGEVAGADNTVSNLFGPEGLGGGGTIFGHQGLGGELRNGVEGQTADNGGGEAQGMGGLGLRGHGSGGGGLADQGSPVAYGSASGRGVSASYGSAPSVVVANSKGRAAQARDPISAGEGYHDWGVNGWTDTAKDKLSTFSVDVDTGSYTLTRAKLFAGMLPPRESVRVEEFLNYFRYSYPQPTAEDGALAVYMDAAPSPFTPGSHLLRVGVQGKRLSVSERKIAHLTFLVDVSGSMQSPDKLPLAKRALRMLVDNLRDGDTVALVTYASGVKLVMPPTGMEKKADIHAAIEQLTAGGSTFMASGIELAYQQAEKTLSSDSESRVLILSDGDANVGPTGSAAILKLIASKVKEGVTVTTLGFGMGNYKDELMEQFANKGNGNHFYVDSLFEARRIFQEQLGGTLEVIAKDVKLQVEFNPDFVKSYRLVGYENRDIADVDFRNDKVDAGEIGAGHTVTALYEVELKPGAGEGLATVRMRAKPPKGSETATERAFTFHASQLASSFDKASKDFQFATAVMGAAEIFRRSPYAQGWSYELVTEIARGASPAGNAERAEFIKLLGRAKSIVTTVAARD
jgi:Ca-activated chloride channel family protein